MTPNPSSQPIPQVVASQPPRLPKPFAQAAVRVASPLDHLNDIVKLICEHINYREIYAIASPWTRHVLLQFAAGNHLPRDAIPGYTDFSADGQRYRNLPVRHRVRPDDRPGSARLIPAAS